MRSKLARFSIAALALGAVYSLDVFAIWPENLPKQPSMYVIHGYLDRAPENTKIADRIDLIHRGFPRRTLLVTSYGTPGETPLDRYLSRSMSAAYSLSGAKADVERVMTASAGTKIEGTFVAYTDAPPKLLIAELQSPADETKQSSSGS